MSRLSRSTDKVDWYYPSHPALRTTFFSIGLSCLSCLVGDAFVQHLATSNHSVIVAIDPTLESKLENILSIPAIRLTFCRVFFYVGRHAEVVQVCCQRVFQVVASG